MINGTNIPNDAQNTLLSRAYKELLETEFGDDRIKDPLYLLLNDVKSYHRAAAKTIAVPDKDEVRKSLMDQISPVADKPADTAKAPVYRLTARKWIWAAAAVALVLFTSIFLLRQSSLVEPAVIASADDNLTRVELPDGSNVTLRPNSVLYQTTSTDSQTAYSLTGEALFDVTHNPNREFLVETTEGRVRVLGTTFNLNERNSATNVYLIEGRIAFETLNELSSVTLTKGEAATIRGQQLSEPFQFEESIVTSWTQNRLIFTEREAGAIADELEFHFGIEIEMEEHIRSEVLGGSITLEDRNQSLEDLEVVLGGTFVRVEENRYQFQQQ